MISASRRRFLQQSLGLGAAALLPQFTSSSLALAADEPASPIKLGLCTFLWGQNWDLPTILANCQKARIPGVELRVEHKHGVEPNISKAKREEVKKRFADAGVTLVGFGTNQMYDSPDPQKLKKSIEGTKAYLQLSHDCGASGVKVKPNDFQPGVSHEKTIEQIGRSLNSLGQFAADLGQQLRLEVHGSCREPITIKRIMDIVDHPSIGVCWNCNPDKDLADKGLEYNFNLVAKRLGATLHVHELALKGGYPYTQLFALLKKANYAGWALLECASPVKDPIAALVEQREAFERLTA
jgi:sugar phosphate isomerase/epimerase